MELEFSTRLWALVAAQEGLISAAQCQVLGLSSRVRGTMCERGAWVRVVRGVYDTAPRSERSWQSRRRRTALVGLLRYGPESVAVGSSALVLLGAEGIPAGFRPEVTLGRTQARTALRRRRRGWAADPSRDGDVIVDVRQFDTAMETVQVHGFQVAAPRWALAQAVPELPRRNAVAVMDSMLNRGLLDPAGLDAAHGFARGRRGVARTHEWWALADGRADSPLETFGRLDCFDHGVPPDELQVEIRDEHGILIGRGDAGWRIRDGRWLIAEFDGQEFHEALPALLHDRSRQNELQLTGRAEVLRFTFRDTTVDGLVARTVHRALSLWR